MAWGGGGGGNPKPTKGPPPDPLVAVRAEEPGVVPLLDHHEGDAGLVVLLQLDACLPDGQQLVLKDL